MQPEAKKLHQATTCSHCGLDVPSGLLREDREEQFCCSGCLAAYSFIHQSGMEYYYSLRDKQFSEPSPSKPDDPNDVSFEHFDDDSFWEKYVRSEASLCRTSLYLEGVHCAACVWLVEQLPQIVPGVHTSTLEFSRARASISWDPTKAKLSSYVENRPGTSHRGDSVLLRRIALCRGFRERDRAPLRVRGGRFRGFDRNRKNPREDFLRTRQCAREPGG